MHFLEDSDSCKAEKMLSFLAGEQKEMFGKAASLHRKCAPFLQWVALHNVDNDAFKGIAEEVIAGWADMFSEESTKFFVEVLHCDAGLWQALLETYLRAFM